MKSFEHGPEVKQKVGHTVVLYRHTMFFERDNGERYEQDSELTRPFVILPGESIDVTAHITNHWFDENGEIMP